jgi:hypothetical protein
MTKKLFSTLFLILGTLFILNAQMIVPIGDGTTSNGTTGNPTPYGTYYKNFRQQYLYSASELFAAGAAPGTITALAFNVQALNNCITMPNFRIRVKQTNQTALTNTFEVGEYTQVWHHDNFLPDTGWNIHVFQTPLAWDGASNILVDILTDLIPVAYTQNASVFFAPTPFTSSLRYQSDSVAADTATTGTVTSNRSNTRFYLNVEDMGSLRGTVTEAGAPLSNVTINIEDSAYSTTTEVNGTYSFAYVPVGAHTVTASKPGYTPVSHTVTILNNQESVQNFSLFGIPNILIDPTQWNFGDISLGGSSAKQITISNAGGGQLGINSISISGNPAITLSNLPTLPTTLASEESITFTATFSPNFPGEVSATITIYDNQRNEARAIHSINLTGNGVNELSIGDGDQNAKMPLDFWYKASMFETIYTADELNNFVGMITGLRLYNSFVTDLPNMPTKIWLGNTAQNNLADGWIPSTDLTLVFDGNVNYPSGENTISIEFPEPFMYLQGGNLAMMVQRPLDTVYYSSSDNFKAQTVGSNRSRKLQSDTIDYDPTAPDGGTLSGQFPKTTFMVIPGGVGHITGTVLGESSAPLAGVRIALNDVEATLTDSNGQFQILNLLPGEYSIDFSIYGYLNQTVTVNLEEDETEILNITMQAMPRVSVSGTILASDTGAGIAGATITLLGYQDYQDISAADGSFMFPQVYGDFSYSYSITHPQYTSLVGSIQIGQTAYSFGAMQMNELAFAPYGLLAELSPSQNAVNLSWQSPNQDAIGIVESFEAAQFPPQAWEQIILNNSGILPNGAYPTWHRNQEVIGGTTPVSPTDGTYQAGLWWDYSHQDEWLISPSLFCPSDAVLSFDSYVFYGSVDGDNYYVKLSTDDGSSWTTLWNASEQSGGWNYYAAPVVIDLSVYSGRPIRIAFHAEDPPSNDGLYYQWFIDKVQVVSAFTRNQRALEGYDLWRFSAAHQTNPELWTQINPSPIAGNSFSDTDWSAIPQGEYLWAVKARYSNEVSSSASFSNPLEKLGGIPAAPQNLQIEIFGEDISLSWDPVTTDTSGNPISVTDYSLHILNGPDDLATDFNIIDLTTDTSFYFPEVTPYLESVFFCVKARANARGELKPHDNPLLRLRELLDKTK